MVLWRGSIELVTLCHEAAIGRLRWLERGQTSGNYRKQDKTHILS